MHWPQYRWLASLGWQKSVTSRQRPCGGQCAPYASRGLGVRNRLGQGWAAGFLRYSEVRRGWGPTCCLRGGARSAASAANS